MKRLYLGSRDYKPEGYLTVDIDPGMRPDLVADITDMKAVVESESCDEIIASHVLEHIDWPDSFKAFVEFSRVLKIGGQLKVAVPDLSSLLRMVLSGDSPFYVIGLIYGVGGRTNRFEQHRYGFTIGMMVDILDLLGFTDFDWWNSDFGDASNGWCPKADGKHLGISLNIQATKAQRCDVDTDRLIEKLYSAPMSDLVQVAAENRLGTRPMSGLVSPAKVYQRIHYQLIEANQRIRYLEGMIQSGAKRPE